MRSILGFALVVSIEMAAQDIVRPVPTDSGEARAPSWSFDGERIAFENFDGQGWRIGIVRVGVGEVRYLSLPFDARMPAWHPREERLAVVESGRDSSTLHEVNLASGESRVIARVQGHILYPTWSADGESLLTGLHVIDRWGLRQVRARDGRMVPVLPLADRREMWPRPSTDGKRVVFFGRLHTETDDVYLYEAGAGAPRRLTTAPGHDFVRSYHPSRDCVVLVSQMDAAPSVLRFIDLDGRELASVQPGFFRTTEPAWSPEGRRLAFAGRASEGGRYQLYVIDDSDRRCEG